MSLAGFWLYYISFNGFSFQQESGSGVGRRSPCPRALHSCPGTRRREGGPGRGPTRAVRGRLQRRSAGHTRLLSRRTAHAEGGRRRGERAELITSVFLF